MRSDWLLPDFDLFPIRANMTGTLIPCRLCCRFRRMRLGSCVAVSAALMPETIGDPPPGLPATLHGAWLLGVQC